MAVQEFKSPFLRQLPVASVADPGKKPIDPNVLRQFMGLLAKDLNRFGMTVATIAADHQLSASSKVIQKLDTDGASKDVRLPVIADIGTDCQMFFLIINAGAAGDLVVKKFTGSAEGATVVTINNLEAAIVAMNGSDWAVGAVFSIALT